MITPSIEQTIVTIFSALVRRSSSLDPLTIGTGRSVAGAVGSPVGAASGDGVIHLGFRSRQGVG